MLWLLVCQLLWWPWMTPAAYSPAPAYCFHSDARWRLDSLVGQSADEHLYQRMVLTHNLAFNKSEGMRDSSDQLLKRFEAQYGVADSTIVYRATLDIMHVRDHQFRQYATGAINSLSFGIFGSNPKDKVRKCIGRISECVERNQESISFRIHRLTAALETAEHLDEMFALAISDLKWLSERDTLLDTAEACLYRLAWARYAYKYCMKLQYLPVQSRLAEIDKGIQWIDAARVMAVTPGLSTEVAIWEDRLRTLRHANVAGSP